MKKEIITPKQSVYQVHHITKGVSVTSTENTLEEAKRVARFTMEFAEAIHAEIEKMDIKLLSWPAWYKGEPSPEPEEKLVWELEKEL